MQHGTEHWGGRRLALRPAGLLLGVLAVFVLVHMGAAHDPVMTDVPTAGSHQQVGVVGHADDHVAPTTTATASLGPGADRVQPEGGHGERGHADVLVGCLVALTGLVGGLMLARPRLLRAAAAAAAATAAEGFAVASSRALRTPPAPSLASLCVLRT